jgi:hypothetical protein
MGKTEAIEAIEARIVALVTSETSERLDSRAILELSEARAWLVNPSQPHGAHRGDD